MLAAALPRAAGADPYSVTLLWTATGDDQDVGRASSYELRYSANPVGSDLAAWWNAARRASGLPSPSYAGQVDSTTVRGLTPQTTYSFVLRVYDDVGNASGFSNVLAAATDSTDGSPPTLALPELPVPSVHAYPNPAQDQVNFLIHVEGSAGQEVRLRLFDLMGKVVADIAQGAYPAGDTVVSWPRVATTGNRVAPGYYESIGTIGGSVVRERLILLP